MVTGVDRAQGKAWVRDGMDFSSESIWHAALRAKGIVDINGAKTDQCPLKLKPERRTQHTQTL